MGRENSREYYVGRSARERELAEAATNPAIAGIHSELADRYDWLADNLVDRDPYLKLVLTSAD